MDTQTQTTETPIDQLEMVIRDTRALSPADAERAALITSLREIAHIIPTSIEFARTCKVESQADAEHAASSREHMVEKCTEAEKLLREFDNGLIDRLFKTHKSWIKLISTFKTPLDDRAKQVKLKIISWQQAEEEKAAAEQRRLQAEADERARKERERLEKQAEKLKTPELKEQRLEQAATIVAPVIQVAAPKATVRMQKRWVATVVDKRMFLAAAAQDQNMQGFVDINLNALNRSKAANSMLTLPGISFTQVTV